MKKDIYYKSTAFGPTQGKILNKNNGIILLLAGMCLFQNTVQAKEQTHRHIKTYSVMQLPPAAQNLNLPDKNNIYAVVPVSGGETVNSNRFKSALEVTVKGEIRNENGEGMPGVTVMLKGSPGTGTTTDATGNFALTLPAGNGTLVVSFIGYETQEVPINNRTTLNIALKPDAKALEEVVVVGYSTQRKKDVTGAIATVDAEELLSVPASNVGQALQGRAAGVTVVNEGRPGGNQTVRIRGFGTINNSDPLYVIDGVPTKQGLNSINPNDIESIQVLKDASSSSIYGSRASNGVVIITTKKGKSGKPKLSFDTYYGIQGAGKIPEMVTPMQAAEIEWALQGNAGLVPGHAQYGKGASPVLPDYTWPSGAMEGDPRTNPSQYQYSPTEVGATDNPITRANKAGTDWFREIFQPAPIQNYQLSATGGTDYSRYLFSLNYFDQEGLLIHTGFKRYSIRANTEYDFFNSRLKLGENLQFAYTQNRGTTTNQGQVTPVAMAYRLPGIIPVYDINGNFAGSRASGLGNSYNPMAQLTRAKDDRVINNRIFGNAYAELSILENLTAKTSFGIDYGLNNGYNFTFIQVEASEPGNQNGMSEYAENQLDWTWSNTLNYSRVFGESHNLSVLVGSEAIDNSFRTISGSRQTFYSLDVDYRYLSAGQANINNSGSGSSWALFSLFGRVDYSLKDRYLASVTMRRDGSSRFGGNNRYAVFPAFSLGWTLSEESFLKEVAFLSNLKLRAGWGRTGNQDIGNYASYSTYLTSPANSYDATGSNSSLVSGFAVSALGNPNLKWESTTSNNVGLDFAFLQNKIDGS
ncbi:MAG: TonB-dependent receptor, partial [Adhaeribacter sp.]|nr:TonB-dependent receptor [Adhaeribacter sp.]